MPTITLTGEEYQDLLNKSKTAHDEAAVLTGELVQARERALDLGTSMAGMLTLMARASIEVIRFAVANLPPETIPNWPTDALRVVASSMPSLPDYSADDRDLMNEFRAFAAEAETQERRRRK